MSWFDAAISTVLNEGISAGIGAGIDALTGGNSTTVKVEQVNNQVQNSDVSPIVAVENPTTTGSLNSSVYVSPYQNSLDELELIKKAKEIDAMEQSENRSKIFMVAGAIGIIIYLFKRF